MGLFTRDQIAKINQVAEKSKTLSEYKPSNIKVNSLNTEIQTMSREVVNYFSDSVAILITDADQLHEYVTKAIEAGVVGIDTETTGLDRIKDYIVGASLYFPGGTECYIPMKHRVPIFEEPYKGQLTYEVVSQEFQRFVDSKSKMIFANADFDLSMIYKDLNVDMNSICYYDVLIAWRCLKENESDNALKTLYNKYVLKGKGDPKKFKDFFTPQLFPYCKPEVAKLYAANDAKITYELYMWQLPYVTKTHPKCKKHNLESIADLIWNVEFPLIKICQDMHRNGIYLDKEVASSMIIKYNAKLEKEKQKLSIMVDDILDKTNYHPSALQKVPFKTGKDFSATSTMHVKHLIYTIMNIPQGKSGTKTDKTVLGELNLPITDQILKVRSLNTLISTFVDKLPKATTSDSRIHCQFRQIGASTGRMCIAEGTPITILNGTKNIEDIVPGDYVYCYSDKGVIQLARVINTWCTGHDRECVDITWQGSAKDDVGHLICTPEHLIRKKTGEWVRADELKRYDKLAHLRRVSNRESEYRPVLYGWNNTFDYEQNVAKNSIFGNHDDWILHHINDDTTNNQQCEKSSISTNHTVLSVHPAGKHRVFDIEVEGHHNFIASEINVHNSSAEPNMQNIPSHAVDIRHIFRATPGYVLLSSDYSQQEPKLTAFVSSDPKMIDAFQKGRDIYATIASLSFNLPYEKCLEFHPETGEYQPDGKARRGEAKFIVLGITYGRSIPSIADQLFGKDDSMSQEDKVKAAQKIYDAVLNAFPNLRSFMIHSQNKVKKLGYTETILGRRRHLPDMQLPEFEFKALKNYVNPDIDPLDIDTLVNKSSIPERIVTQLQSEFKGYKYFGQIARRTRELYDEGIRVINNRPKITDATRQVVNSIIQGSAADETKLAILELENNPDWKRIGGRLLIPVHDELIAEVPIQYWKEGGDILSKCMCDAADFLPFPSKCDVTTSFRWYGVEYPCPYKKPGKFDNLDQLSSDEVKWIQYHLYDLEYILPVYENEDGSKPRGDAALGINGAISVELIDSIHLYISNRNISLEQFVDDIEYRVTEGKYRG